MTKANQLVIIGGPSAVGKSNLLTEMRQGDRPYLCDQLCIDVLRSQLYMDAKELPHFQEETVGQLVLHYDFLHQFSPKNGYRYLNDLISKANSTIVLTLCHSSNVLFKRISMRLEKKRDFFLSRPTNHRTKKIRELTKKKELYKNSSLLISVYEKWSAFIEDQGISKHLILDLSNDRAMVKPYERTEVKRILKGLVIDWEEVH